METATTKDEKLTLLKSRLLVIFETNNEETCMHCLPKLGGMDAGKHDYSSFDETPAQVLAVVFSLREIGLKPEDIERQARIARECFTLDPEAIEGFGCCIRIKDFLGVAAGFLE